MPEEASKGSQAPQGEETLRVGVVGTGYWARWCHGAVLQDRPDIDLVGFWGRDLVHARAAASEAGGAGYDDFERLLAEVDALSFAVPPDVQAELATRAANAGKHLLLDKPLAFDVKAADQVVRAVESSGVTTISFMTFLFQAEVIEWLRRMREFADMHGPWEGMLVNYAGSIDTPGSPYAGSTWRRERGGLWDLGPHALSLTSALLPGVESITALRGVRDTVHVTLHHVDGPLSAFTVSLTTPPRTEESRVAIWGPGGRHELALPTGTQREAYGRAVDQWRTAFASGDRHPLDVRYARDIVVVIEAAERCVDGGHAEQPDFV